ncbi:SDR family NAD(P)-dependent oxidoreductase [uncultured Roseibium sp.]|uniref:SDR family oxidoreductase n=1 Tax=uncultured Roseibium sp. TaxID=1936171 RepID=UPI0032171830
MRFQDKVIVITGGAGGIGSAVAKRAEAEGARVAIWDLRPSENASCFSAACDLRDPFTVKQAYNQTIDQFGKVDILVTCAGITGRTTPIEGLEPEEWHQILDINLTSVFLACKYVVPAMREQGHGRIVNIASVAGKEGNANQVAYSSAKAGVIALTKALAKELAETGILVNCVTPAIIETDLIHQMTEEQLQSLLARIPMKRAGKADEVAEMVLWLASEQCSFSTGATFDMSGGRATY